MRHRWVSSWRLRVGGGLLYRVLSQTMPNENNGVEVAPELGQGQTNKHRQRTKQLWLVPLRVVELMAYYLVRPSTRNIPAHSHKGLSSEVEDPAEAIPIHQKKLLGACYEGYRTKFWYPFWEPFSCVDGSSPGVESSTFMVKDIDMDDNRILHSKFSFSLTQTLVDLGELTECVANKVKSLFFSSTENIWLRPIFSKKKRFLGLSFAIAEATPLMESKNILRDTSSSTTTRMPSFPTSLTNLHSPSYQRTGAYKSLHTSVSQAEVG